MPRTTVPSPPVLVLAIAWLLLASPVAGWSLGGGLLGRARPTPRAALLTAGVSAADLEAQVGA